MFLLPVISHAAATFRISDFSPVMSRLHLHSFCPSSEAQAAVNLGGTRKMAARCLAPRRNGRETDSGDTGAADLLDSVKRAPVIGSAEKSSFSFTKKTPTGGEAEASVTVHVS